MFVLIELFTTETAQKARLAQASISNNNDLVQFDLARGSQVVLKNVSDNLPVVFVLSFDCTVRVCHVHECVCECLHSRKLLADLGDEVSERGAVVLLHSKEV